MNHPLNGVDGAHLDDDSLDQRLIFRNTMKITAGHLDEFRRAITDAVEFARANAPQLMVDVFIDEADLEATSFQVYRDSDSVLRHWQLSDPYIANVMRHCTVAAFEVFGTPSDEVRAGLGQSSNMDVRITPRLIGYVQHGAAAPPAPTSR
jgi:quinol monooxygenase YgiN